MRGRVYSTDGGRRCPRCDRLATACRCKPTGQTKRAPRDGPGDGIVRVARSSKGRRGKGVTVITGVPLEGAALKAFAKRLKAACGAGGAVKDGAIEIQGEQREAVVPLLEAEGWTVRRAGG